MDWNIILKTVLISALAVSTWLVLVTNYDAVKNVESLSTTNSVIGTTGNSLIAFIIILVASLMSNKGNFYKIFLMFILITGIVIEIYLITTDTQNKNKDGIYSVTIINFIIRLYYILDLDTNKKSNNIDTIREAVSDIAKQPRTLYRPPQYAGGR